MQVTTVGRNQVWLSDWDYAYVTRLERDEYDASYGVMMKVTRTQLEAALKAWSEGHIGKVGWHWVWILDTEKMVNPKKDENIVIGEMHFGWIDKMYFTAAELQELLLLLVL